jgi:Fic family protein
LPAKLNIVDLDALRGSPNGELVPISGTDARYGEFSYFAYLPDTLPDVPDIGHVAWNAVTEATGAVSRLSQACVHLPNPRLLIGPSLAREAVATSALEGTYGALPDVLEARLPQLAPRSREVTEIRAYEQMAYQAFDWVAEGRPITIGLLSDLQRILAEDSRTPPRDPGRVRQHQVFIGPEDAPIEQARYVPPPPDDRLQAGLDALQSWMESTHDLPVVLRAAMTHYQFESLHPFGDGNGRVGRLLIVLQLLRDGALREPAITISPWLLRRRIEYQDHLLRLSQTGQWDPWIEFFCQGLCEQALALIKVAEDLVRWLDVVRSELHRRQWGGTIFRLAEDLIDWPVITMRFAADKYEVSVPTAKSAIDRLVEIGVLEELTGRSYGRVFGASKVISLVESL